MALVPTPLLERVQILLCDADGNLFPSEEPAFDASVEVTNAFLAEIGSDRRFTAGELRLATTRLKFPPPPPAPPPGAQWAVAAGCPTIGNLLFVAADERQERAAALEAARVLAVVSSWHE